MIAPKSVILVEAKAPYDERALGGLDRTIRRLTRTIAELPKDFVIAEVILAIASELTESTRSQLNLATQNFKKARVKLTIWEANALEKLFLKHFLQRVSFTAESLEHLLFIQGEKIRSEHTETALAVVQVDEETNVNEYVVMSADFCSYSRFVHASSNDAALSIAIMSRFYRTAQIIIKQNHGELDKFIGDGILVFWKLELINRADIPAYVESCARQLIGMALSLAKEWQDQIDLFIPIVGMRVGAAVGPLLLIPEDDSPGGRKHGVGEVINIAVRLSKQEPNHLTISNRLKQAFFQGDLSLKERKVIALKNVGDVLCWEKDFSEEAPPSSIPVKKDA